MEVFRRREFKYRIDERTYDALMERVCQRLTHDAYHRGGKSVTICNVYYDTPGDDLIRASIEKPAYKEKLRMRAYGIPAMGDEVFVEIKKKVDGVVGKRRIALPLHTAERYLQGRCSLALTGREAQIDKEIGCLLGRYDIIPAVYLAYDRVAWYDREDDGLRVTFDRDIRARRDRLCLAEGDDGRPLLPEGEILMEIKAQGGMPLWLARALSETGIRRCSFSKYGTEFMQKISAERGETAACSIPFFQPTPRQAQPLYPLQPSLAQSARRSS